MAKGLVKNLIGILSIPLVFCLTRSFYLELIGIEELMEAARFFLFGAACYVLVYVLFFKLDYLYIAGHELVHVLCVWLFGGRILSFNIKKTGGAVVATKSNIFIDLMPYLLPIYTILILFIYFIGACFWEIEAYIAYVIFFIGFSFSFHIVMTMDKVKIEQPDFLKLGYLNSLILIYVINLVLIAFFLGFLFPDFVFADFIDSSLTSAKDLYIKIFEKLFLL